jgi:uncharacterized CHY-type Zn-finger protein
MSRLRQSACGQECTLRIPGVCCGDRSTTVLAHLKTGGMSRKCPDTAAVYACVKCHDLLDRRHSDWREYDRGELARDAIRALVETHEIMIREGVLKI